MSRVLDATFESLAALLGIPTTVACVTFNTLGVSICNSGKDITLGSVTFSGLGRDAVSVTDIGESLGVEVGSSVVKIKSHDQTFQSHILSDSFRDDTATVTVVYFDSGAWVSTGWATTFRVDSDAGTANEVVLRFRASDAVKGLTVPRRTTQEDGCQHDYRRGLCGYRGELSTCDKTLSGPNGCKVHFPDLTATDGGVSVTLVQPKPFGGFPGTFPYSLVRRG